jgi:hypothetical protein
MTVMRIYHYKSKKYEERLLAAFVARFCAAGAGVCASVPT